MTVLQVAIDGSAIPDRPAGAGRYVLELVAALAERDDMALTVLARRGDRDRWTFSSRVNVSDRAPVRRPPRLLWEQFRLPRLLRRLPVAVHHGPHYTMPERSSLPKVVTVHDCTFFDHPEWHERSKVWLFRRAIKVAAARADAVVCVSASTAERFVARCSPRVPVHVIPHGVDHQRFRPDDTTEAESHDLALLEQAGVRPPFVAFVGTIEPRKGVPTLVAAFDFVAADHPALSLVLAGGQGWGAAGAEVAAAIAEARHGGRIHRPGYVAEALVAPLLRRAAVVAYPSLDEGFGLPALETLACGAPLVTTAGTAMAEVAGPAALLIQPGDHAALAEALESVLAGDPGQAARTAAGLRIAARHTWAKTAAAHAAVYAAASGRADGQ